MFRHFIMQGILGLAVLSPGLGQGTIIPLWPDEIPNQRITDETEVRSQNGILRISNVQEPTLEVYLPAARNTTGQAVVICPGGGYRHLAYDWEGTDVAKWFNSRGVAAFVLKYRLPLSPSLITPRDAPLQDAQRAIRMVRANASKWNIDVNAVGVMGFSAGGHLASTLGTHYKQGTARLDSIDAINARPDFLILVYPVITMDYVSTHQGSRHNLLGENPDPALVELYSSERQVDADTPPTFLVHASDDQAVPVDNSLAFYKALQSAGVSSELHIYPHGGHGFGLAIDRGYLQTWPDRLADWLKDLRQ